MAHTIVMARIPQGYSMYDHLVDSEDEARVRAMVGTEHKSYEAALKAVNDAFDSGCDSRVRMIPIQIATRVGHNGPYFGKLDKEAQAADKRREAEENERCEERRAEEQRRQAEREAERARPSRFPGT